MTEYSLIPSKIFASHNNFINKMEVGDRNYYLMASCSVFIHKIWSLIVTKTSNKSIPFGIKTATKLQNDKNERKLTLLNKKCC
jgi:hypothetical protein